MFYEQYIKRTKLTVWLDLKYIGEYKTISALRCCFFLGNVKKVFFMTRRGILYSATMFMLV
jgi:hypothetical protein